MFDLLSFPPVRRGLLALILAGATFPLAGVFILRQNLVNIRFMLMHGVMLAGAAALAFSWDSLLTALIFSLVLVFLLSVLSRKSRIPSGVLTTFFMVVCIGLAMILIYRSQVPVAETMGVLWGSLLALVPRDLYLLSGFCAVSLFLLFFFYRPVTAVLMDPEAARVSGVHEAFVSHGIMILTGITIAFAMRLVGALLLDALVLLPAMTAVYFSRSLKQMFISASLLGLFYGLSGFFISLQADIPVSSGVILVAGVVFGCVYLVRYIYDKRK